MRLLEENWKINIINKRIAWSRDFTSHILQEIPHRLKVLREALGFSRALFSCKQTSHIKALNVDKANKSIH